MPENGQFRTGPPHTAEETLSLRGSGRSWSVALVTVAELEEEDGAGEHQGGAVGDDDRQLALPVAVGQPQAEAGDEHQEHPERNVLGRMGTPDPKHLGHEGEGGAEGGGVAGPVEEGHRWFPWRKLLETPSSWQGSVSPFSPRPHRSLTMRRWKERQSWYRLRPKTGRYGSCSAFSEVSAGQTTYRPTLATARAVTTDADVHGLGTTHADGAPLQAHHGSRPGALGRRLR